jgi:predicted esterase
MMPPSIRRCLRILPLALCLSAGVSAVWAQDAGLVLSTSVGYNTQRNSLPLTPEQAAEAARLGREAAAAGQAGKYGDALRLYAQGMAAMHGVAWTPEVALASSLRAKLDHAMVSPGPVTISLTPLYASDGAAAKLSATVFLVPIGKEGSAIAPKAAIEGAAFTEKVTIPETAAGDYNIEMRLTEADGTAPAGLRAAFVKTVPVHVEELAAEVQRLRDRLSKIGKRDSPALPSAQYTLALYDRADHGDANPRAYNFKNEFASAEAVLDALEAGKDPFGGKHGDFRRAYRSAVDQSLQPYRLFVPDGYDGSKAVPLMIALHGMGGDENSMFDSYGKDLPKQAQRVGFIVACPKGREPASMYRGSAEQDVLDVMAEVERDYKVDRSRVYLMGHSMGGYGTWSIAMAHPDVFAALGPISGGGDSGGMVKIRNIPQYVTHGDNDKTVNVNASRSMVEAGKKAGAPITYVEVPGGSHTSVAEPAFAPMVDFFAKQSKAKAASER